jgi:hypothetical protein
MASLQVSQHAGVRSIIGKDKVITAAKLGHAPQGLRAGLLVHVNIYGQSYTPTMVEAREGFGHCL